MAIRKEKETHSKHKQNKNRIIREAALKVAEQNKLLPRSPENLKQSDTEPINQGDGNENVNNGSKFNRRLSKYSAAINTDWRRRALNRCYDGDIYNNLCLLYQGLYWMIR